MKIIRTIGNVLAGIVSVVYFFVLFAMMVLGFVSNVFSANYYKQVLNDVDLSEIKLSDVGVTSFNEEFGEDASVEDVLVKTLEEAGVSRNDATKIVNNEKVNEVVGTFLSDTMVYLANNEEVPQLNYQDAEEIMKSNEISSVLEYTPTEEELKQLVDELNKYIAESFEGGFNYDE